MQEIAKGQSSIYPRLFFTSKVLLDLARDSIFSYGIYRFDEPLIRMFLSDLSCFWYLLIQFIDLKKLTFSRGL